MFFLFRELIVDNGFFDFVFNLNIGFFFEIKYLFFLVEFFLVVFLVYRL